MTDAVLVLNASYEYLNVTSLRRAVKLLCKDKAHVIETVEEAIIRSSQEDHDYPSVIRMKYYIKRPYKEIVLSRKNVIERDDHTCQYCGGPGDTIDHVHPRSRGGKNTWENLVCACQECNRTKGDLTPGEADMLLLDEPRRPTTIPWLRNKRVKSREEWRPYLFL